MVKALCLGAKAVGIGRAALWGLGAAGPAGVERTLQGMFPPPGPGLMAVHTDVIDPAWLTRSGFISSPS